MSRKYREYTYEEYKRAMDMLREGYKPPEISRALGIPIQTIYDWKHGRMTPLAKWTAKPCIELAYVIGAIHGDGSVSKNETRGQYIIILATIDKEFAETFSRAMSRLLDVSYHKSYWSKRDKAWCAAYDSKAFYLWYKEAEREGLEGFKEYIEYNKETVRYYLRGLFDSEGNNYRNKLIRLYNTNKGLLEYVQYLLEKYFNVKATEPYLVHKTGSTKVIKGVKYIRKHDFYEIAINRKQHIHNFLREVGFSIARRQLGLKKDEKVFVEGRYVQPFKLVELGLFKLPFNQ